MFKHFNYFMNDKSIIELGLQNTIICQCLATSYLPPVPSASANNCM